MSIVSLLHAEWLA